MQKIYRVTEKIMKRCENATAQRALMAVKPLLPLKPLLFRLRSSMACTTPLRARAALRACLAIYRARKEHRARKERKRSGREGGRERGREGGSHGTRPGCPAFISPVQDEELENQISKVPTAGTPTAEGRSTRVCGTHRVRTLFVLSLFLWPLLPCCLPPSCHLSTAKVSGSSQFRLGYVTWERAVAQHCSGY
jgi:hypothetical protein